MSKMMFEELKDINLRARAILTTKSRAWSATDPLWRRLDSEGWADENSNINYRRKNLWWDFKDYKKKQMKLRAELRRYMKKFAKWNGENQPRLEAIVNGIVADLVAVQQEFEVWKKEVDAVLSQ